MSDIQNVVFTFSGDFPHTHSYHVAVVYEIALHTIQYI